MEGNLRFKIDWASVVYSWKEIYRFCFVLLCIWRGDLTEGFLRYEFWGAYIWRADTWRSLFSEFYSIRNVKNLLVV